MSYQTPLSFERSEGYVKSNMVFRLKADAASLQTGNGEGPAPVAPVPDVKPVPTEVAPVPEVPSEIKSEAPAETIPEAPETKQEAPEAKSETPEVIAKEQNAQVEPEVQTAEVKQEVSSTEVKPDVETISEIKPEVETNSQVKEVQPVVEAKTEVPEAKLEQVEAKTADVLAEPEAVKSEAQPPQNDWTKREAELLKKIEDLQKSQANVGDDKLKAELKTREDEVELLRARVKNLETELQAALSKPGSKNHEMIENIKQQHEELLSKARGMIFDKTKMVKNQELQIEALTTQVQSLKDINQITKDLLEIRNSEVKAMEDRLEAMEARFKAEKERHGLMLQKAETSSSLNGDLKKEYEMQLGLFKELRVKYEERVQALVAENARLKDLTIALKGDPTPPQS